MAVGDRNEIMPGMRNIQLAIALLAIAAVPVIAQDVIAVGPKNAKVEFENENVRVVRLKMAPHETLQRHDRPARVVIALSANDLRITGPDGKPRMLHVPAGNVGWAEPTRGRSVETLDSGFENVIVEIKNAKRPAEAVTHPPSEDDPRALIEPKHHWVFENQYLRVYDVHIPPGQMTEFHTHAIDAVAVNVSDGLTAAQKRGEEWEKAESSKAGDIVFLQDTGKLRVHRVRNDGPQEFHVVLVQLMRK